jgi:hypothetical protein
MNRGLLMCAVLMGSSLSVLAQETIDQRGLHPTQEELAERQRRSELLRHPTFITLRLVSAPRDVPREKSTDTPAPYNVKDWIGFRLLISQNLFEEVIVPGFRNPHYEVRPELTREGEILPYSMQAEARIKRAEWVMPPASDFRLKPGSEYEFMYINLDDWYDALSPGRYQLTVRRRFDWQGDWVTSTPAYFEVRPRPPGSPIPAGVSIEVAPEGFEAPKDGRPYRLGSEVIVVLFVRNNSDQPLKINVIDREYGNRPQLFKDGVLIPYRDDAAELMKSKEENPRLVEIVNDFFLDPKIGTWSQGLSLKNWYGPLSPGSYRLIMRHRFEMDGPWTEDTAPLLFEISPAKAK